MRKRTFAVLLLSVILAVGGGAWAISGVPISPYFSVTVGGNVVGITACGSGRTRVQALVQVQGNQIYYRLDSSTATPVATNYIGNVGDWLELPYPDLFGAIWATGSATATLSGTCFSMP